jgi:hypothetical protein
LIVDLLGGEFLVKIISRSGDEEKFDKDDVKKSLEAAGLPKGVADEVAKRVDDRVQDKWTAIQVNEQVSLELKRLDEDIHRAEDNYKERGAIPETNPQLESRAETNNETFIPFAEKRAYKLDIN